jgi:hypothetical protein
VATMWSGDASRWRQRGATTVISLSAGSLSWTRTHVTDHHGKRLASWKVLRTRPPRLALRSTSPDVGQPSSRAATAWFATTPLVSCTSSTLSSIVSTAVLARPPLPRGDIAFRALTSGDPGLPVLEPAPNRPPRDRCGSEKDVGKATRRCSQRVGC